MTAVVGNAALISLCLSLGQCDSVGAVMCVGPLMCACPHVMSSTCNHGMSSTCNRMVCLAHVIIFRGCCLGKSNVNNSFSRVTNNGPESDSNLMDSYSYPNILNNTKAEARVA